MVFQRRLPPPENEFILVEYPGIIKNLSNALRTLGGTCGIKCAYSSNSQLRLRYQPDNECHAGVAAERRNLSMFSGEMHLVLKIKRKKSAREETSACCLGVVSTIFSFKGINDFQYLPVAPHSLDGSRQKDLLSEIVPTDFTSALNFWSQNLDPSTAIPFYLPPFVFSRLSTNLSHKICCFYRYNTPSKYLLNVSEGVNANQSIAKSLRSERKTLTLKVNGNDVFPEKPSENAIKDVNLRFNDDYHKLFENLFNERPMWTRIAIVYKTKLNASILKSVLAKYAFYVSSGPWGRLWCKFGYDPRKDQKSRIYQTVVISFRKNQYIPERLRVKSFRSQGSFFEKDEFCDYVYRPGVLPQMRQMWYSVCDVNLPLTQKICQKDFFGLQKCNELSGWLSDDKINSIRLAIKRDVALTAQKYNTDELEFYEDDSQDEHVQQESDDDSLIDY